MSCARQETDQVPDQAERPLSGGSSDDGSQQGEGQERNSSRTKVSEPTHEGRLGVLRVPRHGPVDCVEQDDEHRGQTAEHQERDCLFRAMGSRRQAAATK